MRGGVRLAPLLKILVASIWLGTNQKPKARRRQSVLSPTLGKNRGAPERSGAQKVGALHVPHRVAHRDGVLQRTNANIRTGCARPLGPRVVAVRVDACH